MVKKIIDGKEVEVSLHCPYIKYSDYCMEDSCGKWDTVNKQCCELTQAQALASIAKFMK
jgi:hypothetical protein